MFKIRTGRIKKESKDVKTYIEKEVEMYNIGRMKN